MIEARRTLSLRHDAKPSEEQTEALLAQAITRCLRVRWIYNRTRMQVSPQLIYRRDDHLHCDAIIVEREGMTLSEPKLGSFRLTGLSQIALTGEPFVPTDIDVKDARYAGGIVIRAAV